MKRLLASFVMTSVVLALGARAVLAGSVNLSGSLTPGGAQLPQVAIITTPNCTGAYTAFSVLYAVYSFTVDVGGPYKFTEPAADTALYVYDGAFDPNLPADNCLAATNTNPLDIDVTLAPGTVYRVAVIDDTFAQAGLAYDIGISGPGNIVDCAFLDEFADGLVDWLVVKPDASETGGSLVLTPATNRSRAEVVATSIHPGCSECSMSSVVQTSGGNRSKVWVLGWYADKKNYVELLLDERNDAVVLKQKVRGRTVRKEKASLTIDPSTAYAVVMGFDGAQISVSIDGAPLIAMSTTRPPTGAPGFRAKKATASAEYVCVN